MNINCQNVQQCDYWLEIYHLVAIWLLKLSINHFHADSKFNKFVNTIYKDTSLKLNQCLDYSYK